MNFFLISSMDESFGLSGIFIVLQYLTLSSASSGDRSYVFYKCKTDCVTTLCNRSIDTPNINWTNFFPERSSLEEAVLWNCKRECKYRCMWQTVDAFSRDNLSIPQFYGKWPFMRMFGVQEPASSLFSFLNLLIQMMIVGHLCTEFSFQLPMLKYWCIQYTFSIMSWLWSTIFHAYDTSLTEALDYFGALAFILSSIVTLQARVMYTHRILRYSCTTFLVGFFINHVRYMMFVKFDYGYNMFVAVFFGLVNCFGWIFWSSYWCSLKKQPYLVYCRQSVFGLLATMALELRDFPPVLWTFDAHSLWHASSLLIVFPWYKFVSADCRYLLDQKKKS
ncbi:Post-GPI attachment to proteins factor [Fasciola gigantica]|uniref:Post-GPI attachment to proteins factor 3 n=1 Tax=Fasciola gigantica TaxID=46835 RepID=A0A504YNZ0_FASGI|nr:Post-GPI attachment to proteins factor [Fasciola gigantica]